MQASAVWLAASLFLAASPLSSALNPETQESKMTEARYWHFFENVQPEADSGELRLWVALPVNHPGQKVIIGDIFPKPEKITVDSLTGNQIIFWRFKDLKNKDSFYAYYDFKFDREPVISAVLPESIGEYEKESEEYKRFTRSESWVEITDEIRSKAKEITDGETNPYHMAKRIFDWVIDNMVYEYPDPTKRGSANSFVTLKGDCGEFSVVFCAMCRAVGIPARTVTCVWLTDAGHQWAEILMPGYGWIPVDVSTAQGLAGKSKVFPDISRIRSFADSRGMPTYDADWLYGNLYPERLIVSIGNNIKVEYPDLGISKTFLFMQPGGLFASPPAFEAVGVSTRPIQTGFYVFGENAKDIDFAQKKAAQKMVPGYMSEGEYAKAEKGLLSKLEGNPEDAQTLHDLGRCYQRQDRIDEAVDAFTRSIAGKGGSGKPILDTWTHNFLGECYEKKGETDKAKKEFETVIESGIDFQNSQQYARERLAKLQGE